MGRGDAATLIQTASRYERRHTANEANIEANREDTEETSDYEESEEDIRAHIGAVGIDLEMRTERGISCKLEMGSVFGAAICLPQVGRSAGWPTTLVVESVQCYAYLLLLYFLVPLVLYMVIKEEQVWDKFSGQMHLCDFGAFMDHCPGGGCIGPQGTRYAPKRLYSWDQWVGQLFVRDAFLAIFPKHRAEILENIDPGEYGVEDYWCRLACVFIFFLAMMEELLNTLRMMILLYWLPPVEESWIRFDGELPGEKEGGITMDHEKARSGSISIAIKGMPRRWKLINIVFVVIPKVFIFKVTGQIGCAFLMETASIEGVIVNAVALQFILSIDNMIYDHLMTLRTKDIMERVTDFEPPPIKESIFIKTGEKHEMARGVNPIVFVLTIWRLLAVCIMVIYFVYDYYKQHCTLVENGHWIGGWVSRTEFFPVSTFFSPLTAFIPNFFPEHQADTPYWEFPGNKSR